MDDPIGYFKSEGLESLHQGDYDDAILCFEKAIRFIPSKESSRIGELHHLIAYTFFRKGAYTEAIDAFHMEWKIRNRDGSWCGDPLDQAWLFYRIGKCYRERGGMEVSQECLKKALRIFESQQMMGSNNTMLKKIKKTITSWEHAHPKRRPRQHYVAKNWNAQPPTCVSETKDTPTPPITCVKLVSGHLSVDYTVASLEWNSGARAKI